MDHAWGARSDCRANLPNPPSAYLKRVHVDSIVFTPHKLIGLVELFGANHVLMGTDYPFDMAESDPLDHLASITAFSKQTVEAVAGSNAKRLLNL
jgi:aminocarboxymuconate-semialdehyde decarboxylase